MDVQREENPVLDLGVLDVVLGALQDQGSAAFLRMQFRNACEIVERKNTEANSLRDEASRFNNEARALHADLENKVREAEAECQAAKDAQTKLNCITKEAESLVTHIKGLEQKFDEASGLGDDVQKKAAETIAAFEGNMVALKQDALEQLAAAKGDISNKLKGLLDSAESTKNTVESVKTKSEELVTVAETLKADQLKVSQKVTDIEHTLEGSVTVEKLTSCIEPLGSQLEATAASIITQEKLVSSLSPILAEVQANREAIASLPSAEEVASGFNARAAQEFGYTLVELRDQCNDFQDEAHSLRAENANLRGTVASLERSSQLATSELEVCEGNLQHAIECIEQREQILTELEQRCGELDEQIMTANGRDQLRLNDLNNAHTRLQEAEGERRDLLVIRQSLRDTEARAEELSGETSILKASIDRHKELNESLEHQLAAAQRGFQEASHARDQANEGRSQAQKDLAELHDRLSESNTLHEMLGDAWKDEKKLLQAQISDKAALLDSRQSELTALRFQASHLGGLQSEITDLKSQRDSLKRDADAANSKAEAAREDLLSTQQSLQTQVSDALEEQSRLKAEVQSLQTKFEESQGLVQSLEKGSQDAQSVITDLQAKLEARREPEDSIPVSRGALGDLSDLYLRLAEELKEIPTAPEGCEEFSLLQVAVEIAPFFLEYGGRDNLVDFLEIRSEEWHCFQQVIQDPKEGRIQGTCNKHPDGCLWVRVIDIGTPALDFKSMAA